MSNEFRVPPPDLSTLTPELHVKLWERQQRRDQWKKVERPASWLGTFAAAAPFLIFMLSPAVNESISTVGYIGQFFGFISNPMGDVRLALPDLSPTQNQVASDIIEKGREMGASERDIKIALMTAQQESGLENLDHGDDWYFAATAQPGESTVSDSVGAFQQRDSWGDRSCRLNAKCAAGMFYQRLMADPDRNWKPEWEAAADVQRPAAEYRGHYDQWGGLADKILKSAKTDDKTVKLSKPLANPPEISSGYGMRLHPTTGKYRLHAGIDYPVAIGTPVLAAADGVVSAVDGTSDPNGYGLFVLIKHDDGNETRYAHLSKALASVGTRVKAGNAIALSGDSGIGTGAHLHFELIKDGKAVDPVDYLK